MLNDTIRVIDTMPLATFMATTNIPITTTPTESTEYCGPGVKHFHNTYAHMHGYLSLAVCVFGSIANTLNITVLSRREIRSPTNMILTGLAVADLLVMIEYIPYACHMYLAAESRPRLDRYSYGWSVFVLFHSIFAQVCHTISIFLTVTLAVWRYIAVTHPQKNRVWCTMPRTIQVIISAYIVCPLLCTPLYLSYTLLASNERFLLSGHSYNESTYNDTRDGPVVNRTIYLVAFSQLALEPGSVLKDVDFWIYSVVIKLIPCFLLTILSMRLIFALMETKRRRRVLTATNIPLTGNGVKTAKKSRLQEKEQQTDRTTRMLLAVLVLFLITEFPQGIMGLLSVMLGHQFFLECYVNLGEFMDILALINCAINFILYCVMSRQFRETFSATFKTKRYLQQFFPVATDNATTCFEAGQENHQTTFVTQV